MNIIENKLAEFAPKILYRLDKILTINPNNFEINRPPHLIEAMRYSALNPGKFLRSFLISEVTKLLDGPLEESLTIGAAIELLHCYSLIHDDLPAMDNDDIRRSKPTLHKYYDEATAILAGDALLTLSFELISNKNLNLSANIKLELVNQLSQNAGLGGMVGGQIYDIYNTNKIITEQALLQTHAMKTGALFLFCVRSGALISAATEQHTQHLEAFGAAIGLAFQLADDILDLIGNSKTLGKTPNKDLENNKTTIASLYGIEEARKQLNGLIQEAKSLLTPFGNKAETLLALADFIRERLF